LSDIAEPHPSGRLNKTLSYYGAFIGLGLILGSLGPTIPGLAELTGSTLDALSTIFVAKSAGYLTGALFGGRLFDRYPGNPLLAIMLALMAIGMALVPLSITITLLAAVLFFIGFGEGALDAGGNTLLVWLYPTGLGPWMNGLHFFFGVGAFISPLIVAHVLSSGGSISEVYWILAALLVPLTIYVGVLPSPTIAHHASEQQTSLKEHRLTIVLVGGLLFAAVGAEVGYGNWLYTYALKRDLATTRTAAELTSAYWAAFTVGRLAGIPLAARTTPNRILILCFAGIVAASLGILYRPDSQWVLWGGTIAAGISVAPMFATIISLAEARMPISGRATGWFFVGSSTGGMSIPWVIGQLFETQGTAWTFYVVLADVFVGLVVLVIFNRSVQSFPRPVPPKSPDVGGRRESSVAH
jgi:MFS transporter, FHS family, Na+ dependent glucose transporter 1